MIPEEVKGNIDNSMTSKIEIPEVIQGSTAEFDKDKSNIAESKTKEVIVDKLTEEQIKEAKPVTLNTITDNMIPEPVKEKSPEVITDTMNKNSDVKATEVASVKVDEVPNKTVQKDEENKIGDSKNDDKTEKINVKEGL